MASTPFKLGLTSFQMGAVATDGGMGTTLNIVGDTVAGSAKMAQASGSETDFNIEESDSPVLSITTPGKLQITLSTYNMSATNLVRLFGGSVGSPLAGVTQTLGTITGGSGYTTPGTYTSVPLTGGTGTGAIADITVTGGAVTAVVLRFGGAGYTASDSLSASNTNLGGAGSGFAVVAATVGATGDSWNAPDTFIQPDQSIKLTFKQGGYIQIPRGNVVAVPTFQFNKTALSQADLTITILQPNKAGVARFTVISD